MPTPIDAITEAAPLDEHNSRLVSNVHPQDWINPRPQGRYHLVVIGAGTAGLVTAMGAAGLGAKVALIERHLMGGDCLNSGCVPSKALMRTAKAVSTIRAAEDFGIRLDKNAGQVDFGKVMERMRRLRADISAHESAQRFTDHGVDVYLGQARFTARNRIQVDDTRLEFSRACIATGTRPAMPAIPGLAEARPFTNETIFTLTQLPERLAILGAGPVGVEMAQAFARFGSEVTLIDQAPGILPREDRDAAEVIEQSLQRDGVALHFDRQVSAVATDRSAYVLHLRSSKDGGEIPVQADRILVAAGRIPNVEDLGLSAAGVHFDSHQGVLVDDRLRTSNSRIFAAGDVCSAFKFTHMADAMARIVIRNSLFLGRAKATALNVPWCTYSAPELAHVGLSEAGAKSTGVAIDTFRTEMASVDRAVIDGATEGFVKIHCKRGTDNIVGATIVAEHAGEMISEITLAMNSGLGLRSISGTIHPYPTLADALRRTADAYQRTRLTPGTRRLLGMMLRRHD